VAQELRRRGGDQGLDGGQLLAHDDSVQSDDDVSRAKLGSFRRTRHHQVLTHPGTFDRWRGVVRVGCVVRATVAVAQRGDHSAQRVQERARIRVLRRTS
jgi:hypothetical protein